MPILEIVELLSIADEYVCPDNVSPINGKYHEIEVTFYCDCEVVYSGGESYAYGSYRGRLPEAKGFRIVSVHWDVAAYLVAPDNGVVAQDTTPQKLTDYIAKWVSCNLYHLEVQCDDQYDPNDFIGNSNWDF